MELNRYMGFYSWEFYLSELSRLGVTYQITRLRSVGGYKFVTPTSLLYTLGDAPECGQVKEKLPSKHPQELLLIYKDRPASSGCAVWNIISADHRKYFAGGINEDWQALIDAWGYEPVNESISDTIISLPVNDDGQYRLAM